MAGLMLRDFVEAMVMRIDIEVVVHGEQGRRTVAKIERGVAEANSQGVGLQGLST